MVFIIVCLEIWFWRQGSKDGGIAISVKLLLFIYVVFLIHIHADYVLTQIPLILFEGVRDSRSR